MYTFLPLKTKELFNNISFILLIFIGFIILVSINITIENILINKAIVEHELNTKKIALNYFNDKEQTKDNIINLTKNFNNMDFYLFDKNGKNIYNQVNKKPPPLHTKHKKRFKQKPSENENFHAISTHEKQEKLKPYKNDTLYTSITFKNGEKLFLQKKTI
jgi:hypothetical protein